MKTTAALVTSIALLAATTSAVKWMQVHQPLMVGAEAISFCNVLFVGNLLAGLVVLVVFGPRRIAAGLRGAGACTTGLLLLNGILAVLIPALIFSALQHTTVTNVVLLGRFESVAFALLSTLLLGRRPSRTQWAGYGIIVAGILGLVLAQAQWRPMRGEAYVLLAALLQGIAAILSKPALEGCGTGAFVFSRNLLSAAVFFAIGMKLYGAGHFADAFGPRLWVVMTAYAGLLVVLAQVLWYRSLARLPSSAVASWSLTAPALGILFAWLLLDEVPGRNQWTGAGIILAGMLVTRLGTRDEASPGVLMAEKSLSGA